MPSVKIQTSRVRILFILFLVTAFGLAAKFYTGPGRWWVNDWGPASVAYVIFFMLLAVLAVPRRSAITPIAVIVCAATCALEFLQLWQPSWLQAIRSTLIGGSLLGTTFSWWDFPAYVVGCVAGWYLLRCLVRRDRVGDSAET
jgi:hypothetical protein